MRGIVDPRLMGALESHFPDRCTIQCLTETVDADGQVVKTWTDRHADVPCNVMPLKGREIKRPNQTYVVANTSIALQDYCPDIVESDRAIVGSTTYDILLVESPLNTMTRLSCEVVR
ncbi:MAG TPA: phage head closure protein [Methanoculleus sp.]|uniref:phage head closure protein n=1 Tax=Methanoculleus sp. TaxID=90427 RepID=UPI002BEFC983|nr:phage head closure protein [Methanoculleus sp.]HNQ33350.1 phage head closure protein [Methanoculleus sp.]HNT08404.1 phage head closure protein [Methanoculleus sp.]HOD08842.1 phage head closure protein [Myxococcota bacterium]HPM54122.1 phage head closure protein [Methanoculleus sp.]